MQRRRRAGPTTYLIGDPYSVPEVTSRYKQILIIGIRYKCKSIKLIFIIAIIMSAHAEVEEQIERLRKGNTLPENEVKVLCEKVRRSNETRTPK